jgi:hypothetical protein
LKNICDKIIFYEEKKTVLSEEQIKKAAQFCYYPIKDEFAQCLAWVVEELVCPEDVRDYSKEDMEEYIRKALEERINKT